MYVRLAFAVAAHLEPEILIVDEVLAVGDAQFQKKCLGKMEEVGREGRTVLFVSHNMAAVSRLCEKAMLLNSGRIAGDGESQQVINSYLMGSLASNGGVILQPDSGLPMRLRKVAVLDSNCIETGRLEMCEPFYLQVEYDVNSPVTGAHVICFIHTSEGVNILGSGDADCCPERLERREKGAYRGRFQIPAFLLGEGFYTITVALGIPYLQVFDRHENILGFEIFDYKSRRRTWQHNRRPGILGIELPWTCDKLELR
jgi:lipopolysaccharide transport system ATP-binding protein